MEHIFKQITAFYKSNFWKQRYYRRLEEENISVSLYKSIDVESLLKEVNFKWYTDSVNSNGLSYGKTIEFNRDVRIWNDDPDEFLSLYLHEFGHIQYRQPEFEQVIFLNKKILLSPLPIGLESDSDNKYFSDLNEIRQRIIPIIFYMWKHNFSAEEVYNKTCKYDDIFSLYDKETIIYWISNLL